jgi:uncharacterized protein (TIGR03435 family)
MKRMLQVPGIHGVSGVLLVLGAVAVGAVVDARQANDPTIRTDAGERFDVASVKENRSGDGQRGIGFQPGGRFRAQNMSVRGVIAAAYGSPQPLPVFRVVGGPNWLDSDRYDIEAAAAADRASGLTPPWPPLGQSMLRTLLKERFKLAARAEVRPLPAYDLVMVKPPATLGPQLRVSSGDDCAAPAPRGGPPPGANQALCGAFGSAPPERLTGRYLTMDQLARFLSLNAVERPVANRTGLVGYYSWELDYARNLTASSSVTDPPAGGGTSIFTAVTEQLGLKLAPTTVPLEVVVIESISRPTPD